MNKKEVAEIKKQFSPQNCALTRLCTCYVDGEKNRKMETREAFLSQSEEECFKYFEIFRKCLTGSIGKNLINLDFPLQAEARDGQQAILLQLLQEKLKNDDTLEAFYNRVIETYDCSGSYLICLVHGNYDIPGKTSDNQEQFDSSDEVYEYILGAICPVNLSKAGLSYQEKDRRFVSRIRDWLADMPMTGFLFPAFEDRSTDIHKLLYYCHVKYETSPCKSFFHMLFYKYYDRLLKLLLSISHPP